MYANLAALPARAAAGAQVGLAARPQGFRGTIRPLGSRRIKALQRPAFNDMPARTRASKAWLCSETMLIGLRSTGAKPEAIGSSWEKHNLVFSTPHY